LLLLAPQPLIDSWAWPLTPLTARVLCVIFVLFFVSLVSLAAECRWSATRLNVESLAVGFLFILVGIVRTRATFIWSRPSAWLFLTFVVATLVACATSLTLTGRRRSGVAPSRLDIPSRGHQT
jgi:hypothetical protein